MINSYLIREHEIEDIKNKKERIRVDPINLEEINLQTQRQKGILGFWL